MENSNVLVLCFVLVTVLLLTRNASSLELEGSFEYSPAVSITSPTFAFDLLGAKTFPGITSGATESPKRTDLNSVAHAARARVNAIKATRGITVLIIFLPICKLCKILG